MSSTHLGRTWAYLTRYICSSPAERLLLSLLVLFQSLRVCHLDGADLGVTKGKQTVWLHTSWILLAGTDWFLCLLERCRASACKWTSGTRRMGQLPFHIYKGLTWGWGRASKHFNPVCDHRLVFVLFRRQYDSLRCVLQATDLGSVQNVLFKMS